MPPLIKDGSATLEQGLDFARRRDFGRAREKFNDAAIKFRKEGSILWVNVSRAYADLLSPGVLSGHPDSMYALSSFLRENLGDTELRPGPRGILASDLANQLQLASRDSNLMAAVAAGTASGESFASAAQQLATDYSALGDQILFLPELSSQISTSARSRVPVLMAHAFEARGRAIESADPLVAAENFQTAQHYWTQAGDVNRADGAAERAGNLSVHAKCWICGREGHGHGVQFVSLDIDEEVSGLKDSEASPYPSVDPSGRKIYVCKGCASSLRGLADQIAIYRTIELEERLLVRIRALESALSRTRVS